MKFYFRSLSYYDKAQLKYDTESEKIKIADVPEFTQEIISCLKAENFVQNKYISNRKPEELLSKCISLGNVPYEEVKIMEFSLVPNLLEENSAKIHNCLTEFLNPLMLPVTESFGYDSLSYAKLIEDFPVTLIVPSFISYLEVSSALLFLLSCESESFIRYMESFSFLIPNKEFFHVETLIEKEKELQIVTNLDEIDINLQLDLMVLLELENES